jgi:hypothetical protein
MVSVLIMGSVHISSSKEPIVLQLTPMVGYELLTVHATIDIESNYLNQGVCVSWESPVYSGAGCWSLEGQYARQKHYYDIKNLPAGDYVVQAEVIKVAGRSVTPTQNIHVIDTPFR